MGLGVLDPLYPIHMASGARVSTAGQWLDASSREYKEDIQDLTSSEALRVLEGLNPVTFRYKKDREEKQAGFIAEEVPELVATKERNSLSALEIVAVVTKVVKEQRATVEGLRTALEEQRAVLEGHQKEIQEKDAHYSAALKQKDARIQRLEVAVANKDARIERLERTLENMEKRLVAIENPIRTAALK
jgi:predicted RNase H-like nuclease (RuvC/YqgF family)